MSRHNYAGEAADPCRKVYREFEDPGSGTY